MAQGKRGTRPRRPADSRVQTRNRRPRQERERCAPRASPRSWLARSRPRPWRKRRVGFTASLPFFGQELLESAQAKSPLTEPEYLEAKEKCRRLAGQEEIDVVMDQQHLDALVAPTTTPAWKIDLVNGDALRGSSAKSAALAGYPLVTVPAGHIMGLPVGSRSWAAPGASPH